jgi:methyl-accepting chemotaxis protein
MKSENTNSFSLLLWQKFIILGLIATVLVALPVLFYFAETKKDIDVTQREIDALKPTRALLKMVQLTQTHRGLTSVVLSGKVDMMAARQVKGKETVEAMVAMNGLIRNYTQDAGILNAWDAAMRRWQALQNQVDNALIDKEKSFKEHNALIADYFGILDQFADYSTLSLDPDLDTYYLMRTMFYALPQLTEALGKTRAIGVSVLAQKQATLADRSKLLGFIATATDRQNDATLQLAKVFAVNANAKSKLEASTLSAYEKYRKAINLVENEILNKPLVSFPPTDYFEVYTAAINAQFDLNDAVLTVMAEALNARISALTHDQRILSAGILGLLLLAAFIAFYIARSITRPVNGLVNVMQKLAAGDTTVRANLHTADEMGILGRQFDLMVDQREAVRARIQQENDTLNNSVVDLLMAVAKLAQKDLTARATVAEDITGPVSDALNMLSDETVKVLSRVVDIAENVSKVSQQVQSQSAKVITIAAEEKREVEQAATELGEASHAMMDIAKLAFSCHEAAEKAIKNTDKAQQTVLGTIQGITTIRDTIRETEKRIKRLGERSQEIGGVVGLINDIAERTHILALNASMHAASAGEAGRGFAVVANEVQKLAENSREATSKISALVNNIQLETADTVTTMNDAISQVVRGTDLAQQAGDEMRETRDTTADLAQLVQRISASSTAQSENSQRLVERARQIQKSTDETYGQLQDQGTQTELLVSLSDTLVSSVGVFTLPKA